MKKKLIIIILIILILIISGLLIIRNYENFTKIRKGKVEKLTPGHPYGENYQLSQQEKRNLGIESNLSVQGKAIKGKENSLGPIRVLKIEKSAIIDNDQDGLSDEEEKILGTDPNKRDTDQDGLDDPHEAKWGTDPLNPDTDGDGFLDGDEIKAGFPAF